jgi:glucose-6-phosphate 1-dehydrogenase
MAVNNCAIIIAGASGDLAKRKLIPALHALFIDGRLGDASIILGSGRSSFTDDSFRDRFTLVDSFRNRLFYHQGIAGLKNRIAALGTFSKFIFFLAQPPEAYTTTARELFAEGFGPGTSIIIEKPFGYDLASAEALNRDLTACFDESQIFRIDHYLAKEAVQNILVFRFANALFAPIWNSRYIESIQISALEDIGIFERGAYFDHAGIIRDMVQNHLFQLLCLLTMEAPTTLAPEDIRQQKISLLRSMSVDACYRAQYNGYRAEPGVRPDSTTETYAELKLSINDFRWTGTTVTIRTAKAAPRKATEIGFVLRPLPKLLFNTQGDIAANRIIFKIQPNEGIILDLSSKVPGTDAAIAGTHMNFCYRDAFAGEIPEAYKRLLLDAIKGDRTLFVSAEETEAAWKLLAPVLDKGELEHYDKGTLPESKIGVPWIDFEGYKGICA